MTSAYHEVKTVADLANEPEEYREAIAKIVISHTVNELYGAQVFDEPAIALAFPRDLDLPAGGRKRPIFYRIDRELMERERPNDYLYFVRSGYSGTQAFTPAVWGGDAQVDTQLVRVLVEPYRVKDEPLAELLYQRRLRARGPRIVPQLAPIPTPSDA